MTALQTIDVGEVVDTQLMSRFNIGVAAWMFVVLLVDGYDSSLAGFAAPLLAADWGIRDLGAFAPVFGASVAGIMLGGPVFGYLGDRFGRKRSLIFGMLVFGTATLAGIWAGRIAEFVVLRFIAGVGIGGAMPLAFVMTGEFAPKRMRMTLIGICGMAVGLGGAAAGLTSALLGSTYGWQALLVIGGIAPFLLAFFVALIVPESPKYLALRPERRRELAAILCAMQPDGSIGADSRFILSGETRTGHVSVKDLFSGRMARATPMIWTVLMMIGMGLYFIQSWTSTLFTAAGLPNSVAAMATASFQFGAIFTAPLVGPLVNRFGMRTVMGFLMAGCPVIACVGLSSVSEVLLLVNLFCVGFLLIGANVGMIAISNVVYPAYIRADGVGWAMGLQKLGSIGGAMLGGYLVAIHLPVEIVFMVIAAPVAIGSLVSWLLWRYAPDLVPR